MAILSVMDPLLAHVGHWWIYPLYGVPVAIVLGASIRALVAEREARRREAGSGG